MSIQQQAKIYSESFLKEHGMTVNESLPLFKDIIELRPPAPGVVAGRCLVLGYMLGIFYDQSGESLKSNLQHYGLSDFITAEENKLLDQESYSKKDKAIVSWSSECIQSMLWGLGISDLDHFKCGYDDLGSKMPIRKDPSEFIKGARLRSLDQIYFQSDLLYRMHWAVLDDLENKREAKMDRDLIVQRRRGMDWMLGVEEDWDRVPVGLGL